MFSSKLHSKLRGEAVKDLNDLYKLYIKASNTEIKGMFENIENEKKKTI